MFLRHLKEIGYGVEIKMATTGATFTYVANCFGKWRFKRLRKIYRGSVGISTKKKSGYGRQLEWRPKCIWGLSYTRKRSLVTVSVEI